MADPEFKRFKKLLKDGGHYVTAPRMRIFGILQHHPALSLKQLAKLVNKYDQVTLYRNVNLFEQLGIINKLRLGWETKIELSDIFEHHHHHMTCLDCGKIIAMKENLDIEQHIAALSYRLGFQPIDHQLEIRGYCQTCTHKKP